MGALSRQPQALSAIVVLEHNIWPVPADTTRADGARAALLLGRIAVFCVAVPARDALPWVRGAPPPPLPATLDIVRTMDRQLWREMVAHDDEKEAPGIEREAMQTEKFDEERTVMRL